MRQQMVPAGRVSSDVNSVGFRSGPQSIPLSVGGVVPCIACRTNREARKTTSTHTTAQRRDGQRGIDLHLHAMKVQQQCGISATSAKARGTLLCVEVQGSQGERNESHRPNRRMLDLTSHPKYLKGDDKFPRPLPSHFPIQTLL